MLFSILYLRPVYNVQFITKLLTEYPEGCWLRPLTIDTTYVDNAIFLPVDLLFRVK